MEILENTNLKKIVAEQRIFFNEHQTKSYTFRIEALRKLYASIIMYQQQIADALWKDLHKSEFESYATEIGFVLGEINDAIKNLKRWMKPQSKKTPLVLFGSKSKVLSEPYGVTLILAPWNYPFQLQISPLVGAIAAGNCAVLKPSLQSKTVTAVLKRIIEETFQPNYIALIDIENDQMDCLLAQRFDYIFYTGGVGYGKHIMRVAAESLTPVTLELGGKSPCIVNKDANLKIAARRIVWGKFINSGQTCVAPDYLLVHEEIKDKFINYLIEEIETQYGSNPKVSPDYVRIITKAHCQRLENMMKHGIIVAGGEVDRKEKYIAPTILVDVDINSELMTEEIFGPLLPVLPFTDITKAISFINTKEKPLALYYFGQNSTQTSRVINETTSGGACINDVVVQVANTFLPFGGVGNSGMGNYHGIYGFRTFSHQRAIVCTTTWFNLGIKFAPYKSKIKLLKKVF